MRQSITLAKSTHMELTKLRWFTFHTVFYNYFYNAYYNMHVHNITQSRSVDKPPLISIIICIHVVILY